MVDYVREICDCGSWVWVLNLSLFSGRSGVCVVVFVMCYRCDDVYLRCSSVLSEYGDDSVVLEIVRDTESSTYCFYGLHDVCIEINGHDFKMLAAGACSTRWCCEGSRRTSG